MILEEDLPFATFTKHRYLRIHFLFMAHQLMQELTAAEAHAYPDRCKTVFMAPYPMQLAWKRWRAIVLARCYDTISKARKTRMPERRNTPRSVAQRLYNP